MTTYYYYSHYNAASVDFGGVLDKVLLFNSSLTSHNVAVGIVSDTIKEDTEHFYATIRSDQVLLLTLLPNTAFVQITDDSGKCSVLYGGRVQILC